MGFQINVFDYLTSAQQADVTSGAASLDVTAGVAAAIAAIPSTGAQLLFPPGVYKTSGGFTLPYATHVLGCGGASYQEYSARLVTEILCTSQTAFLFTVTASYAKFENLAMRGTHATPTAGAAVRANGANNSDRVDYESITVHGFYDSIKSDVGAEWVLHASHLYDAVRSGIFIRNTINGDAGDWSITDCTILARGDANGIHILGSGGGKIANNKIQSYTSSPKIANGIYADFTGVPTTQLLICHNDIENVSGPAINIASGVQFIIIADNYLNSVWSNGSAVKVVAASDLTMIGNILVGNGSSSDPAVTLTNINRGKIIGNQLTDFKAGECGFELSGCTDLFIDQMLPCVVAKLPDVTQLAKGSRGFVTDANAATFNTTAAGGGANNVPVFGNQSLWKIG